MQPVRNLPVGASTEAAPLLDTTLGNEEHNLIRKCFSRCPTMSPILVKSLSFGMIGVVFGVQFAGLGKILASYGKDSEAASSLSTSIAVFMIGTGIGFMSSTGVSIAGVSKHDLEKVGLVLRNAWSWGAIIGVVSAAILATAQHTFLLLFEHNEDTREITGEFFAGFAPAVVPDLIMLANGITAFQVADKAIMPPATLALYRLSSIAIAESLSEHLGATGVGLVCSGCAWAGLAVSTIWLKQILGPEFKLAKLDKKEDFKPAFLKFGKDGAQLALQRVTEWGNMAAISMSIGHFWPESAQSSIQPSVETLTLVNAFSQGYGLAAMMVVKKNFEKTKEIISRASEDNRSSIEVGNVNAQELSIAQELAENIHENNMIFLKYMGSGLVINICLGGITFALAKQCAGFFLNDSNYELTTEARNLFLTNALGLLPDSARIISAGILRGRGDIMNPTIANLILMTGIGVPIGVIAAKHIGDGDILPIFIIRDTVGLSASALYNCYRYYQNVYRKDQAELTSLQNKTTV